ncbi:MAG: aspartate kinase [Candidatus Krumholzibacteriia bacterium]|jgi:aspartate kinase
MSFAEEVTVPPADLSSSPILVRKYGGSSLASVDRLHTIARDVRKARDNGYRMVIVVSAMGQTTDELNQLALQVHPTPPRRELDMLLSVGERITMSLLSMALAQEKCPAISFTGSQCGIITDTSHSDARIIEVRGDRVRDALAEGYVVVVAGYQGVSLEKEITTLGRGGSDTTAVALAAALHAERCEILKDVDGVLSADPRCVPEAVQHDRLSWDQMRAVAESGCGVIHIRAVEYAAQYDVPLVVRSSFHNGPGTAIGTVGCDDIPSSGRPAEFTPAKTKHCTERESRYRPLVMNVEENITRIRLSADECERGERLRDVVLQYWDPALTITEWLDYGSGFRWEGLTRQADLAQLKTELTATAKADTTWQEGLTCISLSGGRPDSWLEVMRHVATLMNQWGITDWHLRADGSSLRILLNGEANEDLVQGLHKALLAT